MTSRPADGVKYGNRDAAFGLLSRAYLFTEQYDSVVVMANMVLSANAIDDLEPRDSYIDALHNTASSRESMFVLFHNDTEGKSTGAIGSMYNGDGGWGEIFPSQPYMDLSCIFPSLFTIHPPPPLVKSD